MCSILSFIHQVCARNDTRIPKDNACPSCETWFWLLDMSDENVASDFAVGPRYMYPRTDADSVFAMIIDQVSG